MRNRTFMKFLYMLAAIVFMAGCTAACTYLFMAAYDLGVRSSVVTHNQESSGSTSKASGTASSRAASSSALSQTQQTQATPTTQGKRELVLVNLSSKIPDWYTPKLVTELGFQMDSSVVQPFEKMRAAASKDGISLWVSSAYRSNEKQGELYQREIEEYVKTSPTYADAVASAAKSVAKPGYSEHATGLALDLNGCKDDFDKTDAFRWLNSHAQDYGFILRYPKDKQSVTQIKYEPWHYRYVGTEDAKAIHKAGLCLEEYLSQKQKKDAVR